MACRATSDNLTAAIGILSHSQHTNWQRILLDTLDIPQKDMRVCLVLRSSTLSHAKYVNSTTVLVPCPNLGRTTGPLCSLVRWFETAVRSFPQSSLIGKADDDAVWHPSRVLANIHSIPTSARNIYWGMHENYHWDFRTDRARKFGWGPTSHPCANRSLFGPFNFAKGPLFAVSANLVRLLLKNRPVMEHAQNIWLHRHNHTPWEDVWLGMALMLSDTASLEIHHIGWGAFSEQWGWYLSPSTFVWHMKYKAEQRIQSSYNFMDRNWGCQAHSWRTKKIYKQSGCATPSTTTIRELMRQNETCNRKENLKLI